MDWDTYISLNSYGIANLVAGVTELIPNKFETIRKIANMATGGYLISTGVAMGINNDFINVYAVPTIIAGTSEDIRNLLPMETNRENTEMQETGFTNERANLINNTEQDYERQRQTFGSNNSIDNWTSDVLFEQPVYRPTTCDSLERRWKIMNKEEFLEYYYDKLKEYEDKFNENRLNERLIPNLLMDAKCMIEGISKGEFDE